MYSLNWQKLTDWASCLDLFQALGGHGGQDRGDPAWVRPFRRGRQIADKSTSASGQRFQRLICAVNDGRGREQARGPEGLLGLGKEARVAGSHLPSRSVAEV